MCDILACGKVKIAVLVSGGGTNLQAIIDARKNGIIKDIDILGDYFICGDVDKRLLEPLRGVELNEESIAKALPYPIDDVIMNLETKAFINMLIKP